MTTFQPLGSFRIEFWDVDSAKKKNISGFTLLNLVVVTFALEIPQTSGTEVQIIPLVPQEPGSTVIQEIPENFFQVNPLQSFSFDSDDDFLHLYDDFPHLDEDSVNPPLEDDSPLILSFSDEYLNELLNIKEGKIVPIKRQQISKHSFEYTKPGSESIVFDLNDYDLAKWMGRPELFELRFQPQLAFDLESIRKEFELKFLEIHQNNQKYSQEQLLDMILTAIQNFSPGFEKSLSLTYQNRIRFLTSPSGFTFSKREQKELDDLRASLLYIESSLSDYFRQNYKTINNVHSNKLQKILSEFNELIAFLSHQEWKNPLYRK